MGRIWRIRHKDHQPYMEKPEMLEESTEELVRHLQNPIGWWRDTAQKLILLRKDRDTVTPLLEGLFRFTQSPSQDACFMDIEWNKCPFERNKRGSPCGPFTYYSASDGSND